MVGKEANLLLTIFGIVFFSGFFLANSILMCASLIPLFIYFVDFFITPLNVHIKKTGLPPSARLGDILEVKIMGKITGGLGAVIIYDEVPDPFQLVEGSNSKVISKGFKQKGFSFSYKMRCTKRGNYILRVGWETRHVLGLTKAKFSIHEETSQLSVYPTLRRIRKMRFPLGWTQKTQPSGSLAKIGPLSTNFKEIRNYIYGDPFKIINWKASARVAGWRRTYPLVNEYEREGHVATWLFLDADPDLVIGTPAENAVEYGIQAAYVISYYLLSKGYSVGMYVYNHRGDSFNIDKGKKQFIKIVDGLLELTPSSVGLQVFWNEGFSKAVERNRNCLITQSPWVIIITHVNSNNRADLMRGLMKILAYRRRRAQPNILLINILPYDIIPKTSDWEIFSSKMLDVASRSFSSQLQKLGLTVIDWNPKKESIETTFLRA